MPSQVPSPTENSPPVGNGEDQVVVTVDPEVLDRLIPDSSGFELTQPWATVLAAVFAVFAAFLAWKSVRRQVEAAATQGGADRENAETIARENREAEKRRHEQAERVQVASTAITQSLTVYRHASVANMRRVEKEPQANIDVMDDLFFDAWSEATLTAELLELHGLPRSAKAFAGFLREASVLAKSDVSNGRPPLRTQRDGVRHTLGEELERKGATHPPPPLLETDKSEA